MTRNNDPILVAGGSVGGASISLAFAGVSGVALLAYFMLR